MNTSGCLSTSLSNAAAACTLVAWDKRELTDANPFDDVEQYVGALTTTEQLQHWFNASKLGLAAPLTLEYVFQSCQQYSDTMWNHLVQLHPTWEGNWDAFAHACARYSRSNRCFERFEQLRASQGLEPWNWGETCIRATQHVPMLYFFERGLCPASQWLLNWFSFRPRMNHQTDKKTVVALTNWNAWMVEKVLPRIEEYPPYAKFYKNIMTRSPPALHWARPAILDILRPHLPLLHLAAAWHGDSCWLDAKLFDNAAWCNYASLFRTMHPIAFHKWSSIGHMTLAAPLQDVWNVAESLEWTWPQLEEQLHRLGAKEDTLQLPGDFQ